MSTNKHIGKICCIVFAAVLLLTAVVVRLCNMGVIEASASVSYASRLFDTSTVHTIEISMDDWDSFIDTCENEEYSACDVTIDGETYANVGIRAKGNTSLSTVSSMNSERYSFKIEFDQYDDSMLYYGLDKLCLNNIIQDNTYMKDYLCYQMMSEFGVNAPLCSYVYITVNGEDWGLYLAVEGVEESFLQRNYGNDYGNLYKPDSSEMGGGRGNGQDFEMPDFSADTDTANTLSTDGNEVPDMSESDMPDAGNIPGDMSGDMDSGMSSSDVKLQYIDDDADSYANIFDNAKTDITEEDKETLISSIKQMNEGTSIEEVVNVEEVIRYFVVHNFVCNGDSYTGSIVHNYYLYEKDGQMSMIPWDYNLAFGGFQSSEDATSTVNEPIDTPITSGSTDDRPMFAWITSDETYTELYHAYFEEFLAEFFDQDTLTNMIEETYALIAPYVEKDPTAFCTYDEFGTGVDALKEFCTLRAQSVAGQLDGTIPSTTDGQSEDSSALIDASGLNLSDMGSMETGGQGGDMPGDGGMQNGGGMPGNSEMQNDGGMPENSDIQNGSMPENGDIQDGSMPGNGDIQNGSMPGNGEMPGGGAVPDSSGEN